MSDPQATAAPSLGLSVGATNFAATTAGQTVAIRPSELTFRGQRLTGFVDRVGDPVPLVAPDGSHHHSEHLVAEALSALAHAVTNGAPAADTTVTVPAHWPPAVVDTVRRTVPHPVVSDAAAALTALRANPGLPRHGVVALCDFGGSGTSISLADAAADFAPIGEPVRFADFSGDQIDQALLTYVVAEVVDATDAASTAVVGSLVRLRAECRAAKERLSAETAAAVVVDLPGHHADFRVTRAELEDLIHGPLTNFLATLDNTLRRYGVPGAAVSAVATVGGGARIPLITQQLSEHLRAPVITTAHPQLIAAEGAALIAHRSRMVDTATAMTPAGTAGEPSTGFGALAWSEDDQVDVDVTYDVTYDTTRPEVHFQHAEWDEPEPPPRRSPLVLFGLSAAAAVITTVVFGLMQFVSDTPVEAATTTVAPSPAPAAPALSPALPAPQAPNVTTVVRPVQQTNSAPQRPRPAAPVTQQPPATAVTTAPPTTPPPTTTTPPTTATPTTTAPATTTPTIPPIDPGNGAGETGTGTPPIDPGNGAGTPGA